MNIKTSTANESYRKCFLLFSLVFLLFYFSLAPSVQAHAGKESGKIVDIKVSGNSLLSDSMISNNLGVNVGDVYSEDVINEGVHKLYSGGFVEDISTSFSAGVLSVYIKENPVVSEIGFEGNNGIKSKVLKEKIETREKHLYSPHKIQHDINKILEMYEQKGYYNVIVLPKMVSAHKDIVKIVFEITEGKKCYIKQINVFGNRMVGAREIKRAMFSREHNILSWIYGTSALDANKMEFDKYLIGTMYRNKGYLDAHVTSNVLEIMPDKESAFLTYVISEGEKYFISDVEVNSHIEGLEGTEFASAAFDVKGEAFRQNGVEKIKHRITQELSNRGYVFTEVQSDIKKGENTNTVKLIFNIKKEKEVYVRNINIHNNYKTKNHVIRNKLLISDGERLSKDKVSESKIKLESTDFFSKVEIEEKKINEDQVDLDIRFDEKSTLGQLAVNLSHDGKQVTGKLSISEGNFLGNGQQASISLEHNLDETTASFTFIEPHFSNNMLLGGMISYNKLAKKDDNLSLDITASASESKKEKEDKQQYRYNKNSVRFDLISKEELHYNLSHGLRYRFEIGNREKRKDTDILSDLVKLGDFISSSLIYNISYYHLDSYYDSTKGLRCGAFLEFAGLGGNTKFIEGVVNGDIFYPLYRDNVVLHLSAAIGKKWNYDGSQLFLDDAFHAGSDFFVRGFDYIGPHVADKSKHPIGSQNYYSAALEMQFKNDFLKQYGAYLIGFMDIGNAFGFDTEDKYKKLISDSDSLRLSMGAGLAIPVPLFGRLSFTFSVPIIKEKDDKESWMQVLPRNF